MNDYATNDDLTKMLGADLEFSKNISEKYYSTTSLKKLDNVELKKITYVARSALVEKIMNSEKEFFSFPRIVLQEVNAIPDFEYRIVVDKTSDEKISLFRNTAQFDVSLSKKYHNCVFISGNESENFRDTKNTSLTLKYPDEHLDFRGIIRILGFTGGLVGGLATGIGSYSIIPAITGWMVTGKFIDKKIDIDNVRVRNNNICEEYYLQKIELEKNVLNEYFSAKKHFSQILLMRELKPSELVLTTKDAHSPQKESHYVLFGRRANSHALTYLAEHNSTRLEKKILKNNIIT